MAVTLTDLVAECQTFLYSYFADRDKVTSLSAPITASAVSLTVDEVQPIDQGFIEIDSELLAVKGKDTQSREVMLHPWGRAQRGTVAAPHAAGAKVTVNPRFPASWIATEINTSIMNLFPELFQVKQDTSNTVVPTRLTYPVPADCETIVAVNVETIGPSGLWRPTRRWRFNYSAASADFPSGKTVDLLDPMDPGQRIQLVYRAGFSLLTSFTSTLDSVGVDDSWRDLIKLSVCARMIMALDSQRLQNTSVEASNRAQQVQSGSAIQISRQLWAMYQTRLEEERRLLLHRYPSIQIVRN